MNKQNRRLRELYYITHIDNIPSILRYGILSHAKIEADGIAHTPIYDKAIVSGRNQRLTPNGKSLWSFANLYFQPRNPMLYRVLLEKSPDDIAVIAVQTSILNNPDIYITTGNAASYNSEILPREEGIKRLPGMRDVINATWWTEEAGTKRKIMAEVLAPDFIPPQLISSIYVANHTVKRKLRALIGERELEIIPEPNMFFAPSYEHRLTPNLNLVKGDMFFSGKQTLTISVNTVGVMGKGLASRAKYQFPDAYVEYQQVCRDGLLKMGKPYLYQRETSLDHQLADQPFSLSHTNRETWFLFFATKNHWKENSDIDGIRQGLVWVKENYQPLGIKSLAMPALGCGLGNLQWEDVGPIMCQMLDLDVPVSIHLPLEQEIQNEFLTYKYLFS
ncbi:MAG: DarT ssDNA thymidine ADP-ribosyltransferase family protein [Caldilineales bacterium]|nr:DarT ssDNA thymidine ADP-ribosyltransferase family protein [Caldilineales bacterium]MCW5859379.1 DUF4433 domain-containing protein [Caldilineales bacterium]